VGVGVGVGEAEGLGEGLADGLADGVAVSPRSASMSVGLSKFSTGMPSVAACM